MNDRSSHVATTVADATVDGTCSELAVRAGLLGDAASLRRHRCLQQPGDHTDAVDTVAVRAVALMVTAIQLVQRRQPATQRMMQQPRTTTDIGSIGQLGSYEGG